MGDDDLGILRRGLHSLSQENDGPLCLENVMSLIAKVLPEQVKAAIRPTYSACLWGFPRGFLRPDYKPFCQV
jgi:hypothetical protein